MGERVSSQRVVWRNTVYRHVNAARQYGGFLQGGNLADGLLALMYDSSKPAGMARRLFFDTTLWQGWW